MKATRSSATVHYGLERRTVGLSARSGSILPGISPMGRHLVDRGCFLESSIFQNRCNESGYAEKTQYAASIEGAALSLEASARLH